MALNPNLLRTYNERQIHIKDFLKRLEPVKPLVGKERVVIQDKLQWKLKRNTRTDQVRVLYGIRLMIRKVSFDETRKIAEKYYGKECACFISG